MQEVIDIASLFGVPLNLPIQEYWRRIDELTGIRHTRNARFESAAEAWLPRMRELAAERRREGGA